MFQHMKHLQCPPEGAGRIDDTECSFIAPVLENVKVDIAFFPVEQQAHGSFQHAETLSRELPASRVGGHEDHPPPFPDPLEKIFPPAVADGQLPRAENPQGGAIHQDLPDFDGDSIAVPKAEKGVSSGETPGEVRTGPVSHGRPEQDVVNRDENHHDVGGAPAGESNERVKEAVLPPGADTPRAPGFPILPGIRPVRRPHRVQQDSSMRRRLVRANLRKSPMFRAKRSQLSGDRHSMAAYPINTLGLLKWER
jgi:hypothetical protein